MCLLYSNPDFVIRYIKGYTRLYKKNNILAFLNFMNGFNVVNVKYILEDGTYNITDDVIYWINEFFI